MRFMIIVKSTPEFEAETTPQTPDEKLKAAMADYHEQLSKAGVLLDASGLQPSRKGACWFLALATVSCSALTQKRRLAGRTGRCGHGTFCAGCVAGAAKQVMNTRAARQSPP